MKRKDEIIDNAIGYGVKNPGEFVETPYFSQVGGLYSQSDIEWAFEEGALWADSHPSNELLDNICKWLKENIDLYIGRELGDYNMQYYGTIDKETLLDDFLREFSK